jgi:hypothetical protein
MANISICSIDGCNKPVHVAKHALCSAHYERWKRTRPRRFARAKDGEPIRLIENILSRPPSKDCLPWPFARNAKGYGVIGGRRGEALAHAYICARNHGPRPEGHEAVHSCGNGHLGCVNPGHLRWATRRDNELDKQLHGTHNKGERHGMSKLTEAQVAAIRALKGRARTDDVATTFGISRDYVGMLWRNKRWAHV